MVVREREQWRWQVTPSPRLVREARHRLQVGGIVFLSGDSFADDLAEYTPIVPVMLAAASLAHANNADDLARVRWRFTPAVLRRVVALPRMTDPRAIEIDKCLEAIYLGAYLDQPTLLPVVADAASRLIMAYGLSPSSTVTLLTAGHLMAVVGDLPKRLAISDVAMKLLPHTHRSSLGMARYSYTGAIRHCRDPFHTISDDLLAIRDECLEVGDNIFAGMACMSRIAIDVAAGAPLAPSRLSCRIPRPINSSIHPRSPAECKELFDKRCIT